MPKKAANNSRAKKSVPGTQNEYAGQKTSGSEPKRIGAGSRNGAGEETPGTRRGFSNERFAQDSESGSGEKNSQQKYSQDKAGQGYGQGIGQFYEPEGPKGRGQGYNQKPIKKSSSTEPENIPEGTQSSQGFGSQDNQSYKSQFRGSFDREEGNSKGQKNPPKRKPARLNELEEEEI